MHLRSLGSILGGLTAGPVGSLVGGIAGGLVGAAAESLIPGSSGVISNALGATGAEALQSLGQRVRDNLPTDDCRRINHDLQRAFRTASIEALNDLGGPQAFPESWRGARDVPARTVFSFEANDQELTAILVNCLVQLRRAIEDERLLPIAPPREIEAASVYTYIEQTTLATLSSDATAEQQSLAQLSAAFFDGAIAPWLDDQFAPLMVAANDPQDRQQAAELATGQALRAHLRTHMLERTLVQLNEQLKNPQHTEAWRAFNRLLLEQVRAELARVGAGQHALAAGQQELGQRLDILLSQSDAQTLGQFAGGMADLVAAVGQARQQTGEQLDSLLVRVSAQGDNLLALLAQNDAIIPLLKNSALGIDDVRQKVEQLLDAFAAVRPGLERVAWVIPTRFQDDAHCPYPGLAVFAEQQAGLFYGREDEIRTFLARPPRSITAITGPSGVGKSSFVQAGLLPQLKQRGGPELRALVYRVSTSGELLRDLAAFCARQGGADPQAILQSLSQRDDGLRQTLATLCPTPDGQVLLVLDQFEELFVGDDPARVIDRRRLLDNLLQLERKPEPWLSVILTSRENFFEHPDYRARERLREIVQAENVHLSGLGDRQLREAITRPLEAFSMQHGLLQRFEAGVVDLLLADFRKTERTLPLVQYLLRLLWTEQHELSNAAYNRLGGLERALDRHASAIYERFSEGEQRQVNAVLLALVRPGIAGEYTRRRVRRDVLLRQGAGRADLANVVRQLANPNSRLISEQQIGEVAHLELTHEILLRQWDRLRLLIELYKDRLRAREALLPNAEQWAQSRVRGGGGDSAYLYRGNQLRQARAYVETKDLPEQVDSGIKICYQASVQQRRRSLIFGGAATLAVLLVIGLVIQFFNQQSVVAQQAAQTAAAQRATAEQNANQRATTEAQAVQTAEAEATQRAAAEAGQAREARVARGRGLAAAANTARSNGQAARAGLLALEAVHTALNAEETVPVESEQALRNALTSLGGRPLYGHTFFVVGVLFSPDGQTLVTRAADGTAHVWDLTASDPRNTVGVLSGHVDSQRTNPLEPGSLQISADGRLLATVSGDNSIHIWDLTASDPNRTVRILNPEPAAKLPGVALRNNGRTLISTSDGQVIRIWNLADPDPSATVRTIGKPVTGEPEPLEFGFGPAPIMLARDDRTLVTINGQGLIYIWDVADADPAATVRTLQLTQTVGVPFTTNDLRVSPDGNTLAAIENDNTILVWDLRATDVASTRRILSGHKDRVRALAFSPDSRLLASGSMDASARVWDLSVADPSTTVSILEGHVGMVSDVLFSPDGRQFASVDGGGVRLWTLPNPSLYAPPLRLRTLPTGGPVAFSPDGSVLATNSGDDGIRLWRLAEPDSAAMKHRLNAPNVQAPFLFAPDGHTLIAGSGSVSAWDLAAPEANTTMHAILPEGAGTILTQSPDRQLLVTEDSNQMIHVWDLGSSASQRPIHTLRGHSRDVTAAWMSPNKRMFISGSWDGTVRIWDLTLPDPDQAVRVLNAHEDLVQQIVLRADGHTLVTMSDMTARIWDLNAADPQQSVRTVTDTSGSPLITAISPDGNYFVVGTTYVLGVEPAPIHIWNLTAPDPASTKSVLQEDTLIMSLQFSADSQTLIASDVGETVRIWDLSSPDPSSSLRVIQEQLRADILAISPDGRLLANVRTGVSQPVISIVDLTASDPNASVLVLQNEDEARSLAFSPDGRMLLSGSGNLQIVQVWAIDIRDLIAPACRAIGRNFSNDEWQQYFGDEPYRETCSEQSMAWDLPTTVQSSNTTSAPTATVSAGTTSTPATSSAVGVTPTTATTAVSATPSASVATTGTVSLTPRVYASEVGEIADLELAPDGAAFAIAGNDGTVQLRQTSDGEAIQTLAGHTNPVYRMAFSPDGQLLATDAGEGAVLLWRVANGERVGRIEPAGGALAFAPDGQILATAEGDYKVRLWQVRDGALLRTLEGDVIDATRVVFAPDGQTLAVATADEGVSVWRVGDGALLQKISLRTLGQDVVAFSPDGQVLAICERFGFVHLWRVRDGTLIRKLDEEFDAAFSVVFAPDGKAIVTAATELEEAEVKLWRADDGAVVSRLKLGPDVYGAIEARYGTDGRLRVIAGWQTEAVQLWEYPPAP